MSEKWIYPAYIKQDKKGQFEVYFPTLFPDSGWEYPLSKGENKQDAISQAKKELAYFLAGILYDNEELPEQVPIPFSEGMDLIDVETSIHPYDDEINEHLQGRHWHIGYYVENTRKWLEAIGYKNKLGTWDIYYQDEFTIAGSSNSFSNQPLLFTVTRESEAQEKFNQFVEQVILKRRN